MAASAERDTEEFKNASLTIMHLFHQYIHPRLSLLQTSGVFAQNKNYSVSDKTTGGMLSYASSVLRKNVK